MKTLVLQSLCSLSLMVCSVSAGSHVQVSIGSSSYTHGQRPDMPEPVYHGASAATAIASGMDMAEDMDMMMSHDDMMMEDMMDMEKDMPSGHYMPHPVTPAPAYHHAVPAYHVTPKAPMYHHPTPAYVAHPKPVYHSKVSYHPVAHVPAPQPYHPAPTPAYHQPAPAYHHPAPAYHQPKYNCSVVTEMEKAQVCTPAFEAKCMKEDLMVKRVVDREQCHDITKTVCMETMETVANEVCTYSYMAHTEDSVAKTVEVGFEKDCMTQMVTVCQPGPGYGYHSYGHQYCKEVSQETCYNVPKVMGVEVPVMMTYPEPMKNCVNKPIMLPKVECKDMTEKKCIMVPEIVEDVEMVDKCETMLAAPSCQYIELSLPKQVCVELVYGQTYEAAAHGHDYLV